MSSCRSKPHNSSAYDSDAPQPLHASRICINPPHPTRFATRSPREWHAGRMLSTLPREWREGLVPGKKLYKAAPEVRWPAEKVRPPREPASLAAFLGPSRLAHAALLRPTDLRVLLPFPCCDLCPFASCSRPALGRPIPPQALGRSSASTPELLQAVSTPPH